MVEIIGVIEAAVGDLIREAEVDAKCIELPVLTAAGIVKYPSVPLEKSQYIAVNVSVKEAEMLTEDLLTEMTEMIEMIEMIGVIGVIGRLPGLRGIIEEILKLSIES